ncbi:hypothetical protein [Paenibacillus sp. DMB20]|uniref:hypothetical protein n=1 Tax=Paenibacillus sp. DMB20 TaxID=1642570 RepID=UPI000627F447|nr:hypothetical protein [Paenibacillus sp. DMB20]KKO53678.1 hypothetical protein XI25_11850 [Paenibacillus sp. DMB20]
MERTQHHDEYQDIMLAVENESLPEVDVSEQVRKRITELDHRRRSFLKVTMRGATALGSLLALVLLVTVTAYAASEYIQIRNKSGEVRVQHVAPSETFGEPAAYDKYAKQASDFAKPGDLVAYYVKKGDRTDSSEPELRFEYKERRIHSYEDFLKEAKRTQAPVLPKAALDYAFDYGNVSPRFPNSKADKEEALYLKTLGELVDQASKAASGDHVFMKSLPWSQPSGISGIYSKGKAHIGIYATLMRGGDMYVTQEKEHAAEIVTVAGTEVVYNLVKKGDISYDYINWYNEEQDAYYTLTSFGDKTLTKKQFLQLAEELLK